MRTRTLLPAGLAVALTIVAVFYFVRRAEVAPANIAVTEAWARATPPGAPTAAAYVTIENRSGAADRLVGATTPAAQSATVHETVEENGVSQMREADTSLAPGASLKMQPGGMHIMLMGLNGPLKEGDTIELKLQFEKAGAVTVRAKVAPIGATSPLD